MKPPILCDHSELEAAADAAEQRKRDALAALLAKLEAESPGSDEFHKAMSDLIDADRRALDVIEARKAR